MQKVSYAPSVEGYDPAAVGREREIALGKKSGRKSVEYALGLIGAPIPDNDAIDAMLAEIKQLGAAKKGRVELEEFRAIAARVQG